MMFHIENRNLNLMVNLRVKGRSLELIYEAVLQICNPKSYV